MMEPRFTVETTFTDELFYHRAMVSSLNTPAPKKRGLIADLELMDILMGFAACALFFLITYGIDMPTRIFQSLFALIMFLTVLRSLNKMRSSAKAPKKSDTALKRIAKSDLEASNQKDEVCTYRFGEESFLAESPGIRSEYRYEGIKYLRETREFFMLFRGNLTIIPVAKSGMEEEELDEFRAFLEEKCNQKTEMITG